MEGSFERDQTDSTLESVVADEQSSRADTYSEVLYPSAYITCRLTIKHSEWDVLKDEIFSNYPWYISYPHFGKSGKNEHFHVFVPDGHKRDIQKLRDRIKKLDLFGNKCVSIKRLENGLAQAIQYGSREKTQPYYQGDGVSEWIANAPKWADAKLGEQLNPATGERRKRDDPEGIAVTQRNFLRLCWKFRTEEDIHCVHRQVRSQIDPEQGECRVPFKCDDLGCTLMHMFDGDYYLDPQFARVGMPDFYIDIFKTSCARGKLTWGPTPAGWMSKIFHPHNPRW